jgi:integrase
VPVGFCQATFFIGMRRDTKTRYQGVFARHREGCGVEQLGKKPTPTEIAKACSCQPVYWGGVWDRATGKKRKTSMCPSIAVARNARADLQASLREGVLPASTNTRIKPLAKRFVKAMEDKVALNKRGRPYKQSAIRDIEGALRLYIVPRFGARRPVDVRRRDVQEIVDEISPALSGSRIRTVVNSIHSFYAWAQDRELVEHDPADRVRLPAMDSQPRDRVVTPAQMTVLLNALVLTPDPAHGVIDPMRDVLPFALATYATARRAEIRYARVEDVDLDANGICLGVDDNGRKSRAAQRIVPVVKPLRQSFRGRCWRVDDRTEASCFARV